MAAAGSGVFEQRFTNSYWGIGPHAGVELQREVEGTGLSFVSRIDVATLLGRIRQGFFEESTTLAPNGQFTERRNAVFPARRTCRSSTSRSASPGVRPTDIPQAQLFVGYNYEHWWNVGKISNQGTAAELSVQEILLRLAINY